METINTPVNRVDSLAKKLGIKALFLKREDLHPLGSHKGRSIPTMIEKGIENGFFNFAISSSGNAGLSAIKYIAQKNSLENGKGKFRLSVFVGEKIPNEKLNELYDSANNDPLISITKIARPLVLLKEAEKNGSFSLRQSTNDLALEGYESLAREILEINNNEERISDIFLPASSGTTALALWRYLEKYDQKVKTENNGGIANNIKIHIVQTTAVNPIAVEFDKDFISEKISEANAIADIVAIRKEPVLKAIRESGGSGWVISNNEIIDAKDLLKTELNINLSANAILSFAGLLRAIKKGQRFSDAVLCIITGK